MLINLKSCAGKTEPNSGKIELVRRLPAQIASPCIVDYQFEVNAHDNYYLLVLKVESLLRLTCQRCLLEFSYHYQNRSELAICNSEKVAEQMMSQYDCIVSDHGQVDLKEIITDELNLYTPEFHLETSDCDIEISNYIKK